MCNCKKSARKAEIVMSLTEFEMPPMQDLLIIGKKAPIGAEAAKRMVDILSPEQYTIIKLDNNIIEAIVFKKTLLNILPEQKLIEFVLEEGGKIVNESTIIRAQINITVKVNKSMDI